jgi:proteasome lid subunit RPN8/RPN11
MSKLTIPQSILDQIYFEQENNPDREVCGYALLDSELVIPVDNTDPDPENHFRIDPEAHLEITETISDPLIIWHTHHKDDQPGRLSDNDIISSKALRIPYLVLHTGFNDIDYFDPGLINPYPLLDRPDDPTKIDFYLGWPWAFERSDCYALFRNYYKGMLGVDLTDYSRGHSPMAVCDPDWNLFLDNYHAEGFRKLLSHEPLQDHDVILMNLIGPNVHHAAIVTNAERRTILQVTCNTGDNGELIPGLSGEYNYGHRGYWVEHTRAVIRHKSL